jgi:hypothetical protein
MAALQAVGRGLRDIGKFVVLRVDGDSLLIVGRVRRRILGRYDGHAEFIFTRTSRRPRHLLRLHSCKDFFWNVGEGIIVGIQLVRAHPCDIAVILFSDGLSRRLRVLLQRL